MQHNIVGYCYVIHLPLSFVVLQYRLVGDGWFGSVVDAIGVVLCCARWCGGVGFGKN